MGDGAGVVGVWLGGPRVSAPHGGEIGRRQRKGGWVRGAERVKMNSSKHASAPTERKTTSTPDPGRKGQCDERRAMPCRPGGRTSRHASPRAPADSFYTSSVSSSISTLLTHPLTSHFDFNSVLSGKGVHRTAVTAPVPRGPDVGVVFPGPTGIGTRPAWIREASSVLFSVAIHS